jgi:hypothetical protein
MSRTHFLKLTFRARRRDAARVSAILPYHPDYESTQHEEDDEVYLADGERFTEYGKGRRMVQVWRGSEGYEE